MGFVGSSWLWVRAVQYIADLVLGLSAVVPRPLRSTHTALLQGEARCDDRRFVDMIYDIYIISCIEDMWTVPGASWIPGICYSLVAVTASKFARPHPSCCLNWDGFTPKPKCCEVSSPCHGFSIGGHHQVPFGDAVQEALGERKLLMAWFHQERRFPVSPVID